MGTKKKFSQVCGKAAQTTMLPNGRRLECLEFRVYAVRTVCDALGRVNAELQTKLPATRTFWSAARSSEEVATEHANAVARSVVAADRNVRAPTAYFFSR